MIWIFVLARVAASDAMALLQNGWPLRNQRCMFGAAMRMTLATMLLLGLVFMDGEAAAQDEFPQPPCGRAPYPAYPAGAPPGKAPAIVQAWQPTALPDWRPPACTGWTSHAVPAFRILIALTGRITLSEGNGTEALLGKFAALSKLREVRYWSVSDGAWRPLINDISTLEGPNPARRRPDFAPAELNGGKDVYFIQNDGRSSGDVIYRLRVRESRSDRLIVETENVTPVRLMLVTLFQPGALQTVYFLDRLSATTWGYYSLSRTTNEGSNALVGGHEASYVNRAAALYRFIADAPTDRDPPLAR